MKAKSHLRVSVTSVALVAITLTCSAYAGGLGSTVGGGQGNTANGDFASVAGGFYNSADGTYSEVAGGYQNYAIGYASMVPGGIDNVAGGDNSFAGGRAAHIRNEAEVGSCCGGDAGTFFWSDDSNPAPQLPTSTGKNQFIVKADGGFSLNAAPINPSVVMTIAASQGNPRYASIQLMDHAYPDGILISSGDAAKGANNASFYVDQYNGSGHTRRLSIDATGNLTVTNQAYKPGGGSWAASSDGRLKTNVQPLDHALDQMLALKGVTFEYTHPDNGMHPKGTFSGFIAQEVEKVFPNWIGHDNDGYLTVGPQGFEALTVEALRELKTTENDKVAALERDNAELRKLVADQAKAVADLRREVASIGGTSDTRTRRVAVVAP
jgi:hypothetical protein